MDMDKRELARQRIREVKERAGSAESVARFYGLAINSRTHRAVCPFHSHGQRPDENLSFYGNGFHCFVCGAGGDCLNYTQHLFRLSTMTEAARQLDNDLRLGVFSGPQYHRTQAQAMTAAFAKGMETEHINSENEESMLCMLSVLYAIWYNNAEETLLQEETKLEESARLGTVSNEEYERRFQKTDARLTALYSVPEANTILPGQLWAFGIALGIVEAVE